MRTRRRSAFAPPEAMLPGLALRVYLLAAIFLTLMLLSQPAQP